MADGKAGGVKVVKDIDAVRKAAKDLLGQTLVTKQTGPEGLPINSVYVESGSDIEREIYLSLTLNREKGRVAVIASAAGGMDIEEVAAHTPEKILSANIDPAAGLQPYQCRKLAFGLGLSGKQIGEFQSIVMALAKLYDEKDAALVEVNPLIVTKAGKLVALDAKINIDRQRRLPVSRSSRSSATSRRKMRPRSRRPSTISTTCPWMATSPAW